MFGSSVPSMSLNGLVVVTIVFPANATVGRGAPRVSLVPEDAQQPSVYMLKQTGRNYAECIHGETMDHVWGECVPNGIAPVRRKEKHVSPLREI